MFLASAIRQFLESLQQSDFSRNTIKSYDHHLRRFWEFAQVLDTSEIDQEVIQKYTKYLSKQSLKKSSQNHHLIALRGLLQYLESSSIPALGAKFVELPGLPVKDAKIIDSETLRQVVEAPDTTKKSGLRDRSLMEVLFCYYGRVSEIVSLNREDLDLEGQTLNGKHLSDAATISLETYLKSRKDTFSPLFIRFQGTISLENSGESMRLTDRSIERIVKKYAQMSNLVGITPESFRKSTRDLAYLEVFSQT